MRFPFSKFFSNRSGGAGRSRERVWIALVVVLTCFILFSGKDLPEAMAKGKADSSLYDELKVFTDVLAIVERDYVKPVESKPLVEGAIKGLLATLDPHSGYLDPDFYQDLQVQTRGEFGAMPRRWRPYNSKATSRSMKACVASMFRSRKKRCNGAAVLKDLLPARDISVFTPSRHRSAM